MLSVPLSYPSTCALTLTISSTFWGCQQTTEACLVQYTCFCVSGTERETGT
jgi:hypothetical protein